MTLLMRDQENQEIGEKRGFERGKVQERQKIILKMVKQGFSNEQIIMLCDVSENEIERYRNQE